jgi:hypothetical protein
MVELALNSNVSAATGFTPFELNHGYMPQIDLSLGPCNALSAFAVLSCGFRLTLHSFPFSIMKFSTYALLSWVLWQIGASSGRSGSR